MICCIRYRCGRLGFGSIHRDQAWMACTLLLIVVFLLHLVAFALAVAAQQHRSQATLHTDFSGSHCIYTSDIVSGYGLGSALFLMCSQLVLMVASRCLCCGKAMGAGGSRSCALVLFTTCWLTFLVAEACLLAASATNAYHTKYRHYVTTMNLSCQTQRKGVFQAGAALILFNGVFSQLYYLSYCKATAPYVFAPLSYQRDSGVRIGSF